MIWWCGISRCEGSELCVVERRKVRKCRTKRFCGLKIERVSQDIYFGAVLQGRVGGNTMITIFKDKKDIPHNMDYVELNDLFFNQNTVSRIDERAEKIIEVIDEARLVSRYKICSRFNEVILDIDRLSSGCKTALNVLYYPDRVFCLKECGNNALEILYGFESGNVYSEYALIPFDMDAVVVRAKSGKRVVNDYEELKRWWSNEE